MTFFLLFIFSSVLQAYSIEKIRNDALAKATDEVGQEYSNYKLELMSLDSKTASHWSCSHDPKYSMAQNTIFLSRLSVLAQCYQPKWSLLIPIRSEIYEDVAVIDSAIRYGQILDIDNIKWKKKNILKLNRQYLTKQTIHQALGQRAKKSLAAGDLIHLHQWKVADVLKKNQLVTIIYQRGGVKVATKGKALERGHIGKKIIVENLRSKVKLQGTIIDENTVEVA